MSAWFVYLICKLDSVCCFCEIVFWVAILALIVLSVVYLINCSDEYGSENFNKLCSKWWQRCFGILILFSILYTAIPNSKQAAAIYLLPKIANNEQVQNIPGNALNLLNKKLEQWINETMDKVSGNKTSSQ